MNFFNAVDEFKKDPQLKKTDINNLKEWIIKQPHLPPVTGMSISAILCTMRFKNG